jgi:hypothetical protein
MIGVGGFAGIGTWPVPSNEPIPLLLEVSGDRSSRSIGAAHGQAFGVTGGMLPTALHYEFA